MPVFERLRISPNCPLILPSHVALDNAREQARGANAIGTTGRGIGPAYEDKVARRALRVADLFQREQFAAKLGEVLDFHNFVLQHYFKQPAWISRRRSTSSSRWARRSRPLVADVTLALHALREQGANVLFEGAQGAMLDVDHGTYPFVTSSNTTAGFAATGTGLGPRVFDEVLGIVKAYTTRVGGGPFPTELFDDTGEHLRRVGHEFGAVTGRRRRCGWFDSVALAPLGHPFQRLGSVRHQARCARRSRHHQRLRRLQNGWKVLAEPPMFVEMLCDRAARLRGAAGVERVHHRYHRIRQVARAMRAAISSVFSSW